MRRRLLLIVLCASLIGLLASFLVYRVVSQVARAKDDQSDRIVVAAANIGLAETITSQHVKLVPWPKAAVPPGAIRSVADAEGRVVRGSIVAGEPLMEAKLAPQLSGKGGIMPMLVPEGQRGVTIKLDDATRDSGFVLPNSRVDVIADNSTDGLIAALDLVVLDDDRRYFPPYHAAPVIRRAVLGRHPAVGRALGELAGRIGAAEMRRLNALADVEHRDLAAIARDWLAANLP